MAKHKKGSDVKVNYGPRDYTGLDFVRFGKIVGVVPKGKKPNASRFDFNKKPCSTARDHLSYIVQDYLTGKCYWPLVKYIQAA